MSHLIFSILSKQKQITYSRARGMMGRAEVNVTARGMMGEEAVNVRARHVIRGGGNWS